MTFPEDFIVSNNVLKESYVAYSWFQNIIRQKVNEYTKIKIQYRLEMW